MTLDWSKNELVFLRNQLHRGNVILFAGAGFSVDAKNASGSSPPLGTDLAKLLAHEASLEYSGEPLPVVFDAVQKTIGSKRLMDLLRNLYSIESFASWYQYVGDLVWHRIYTINIDNLLQRIYAARAKQRLDTISCPAAYDERDPLFERLQCVHLHGHVDDLQVAPTFTLADFARHTATADPWYQALVDEFCHKTVLFVGTYVEEPQFQHYLELREPKDRDHVEFRPKSFLVNRTIGQIRARSLESRNIVPIQCTAGEFFDSLRQQMDLSALTLDSVREHVFPHYIIAKRAQPIDSEVQRHFDVILPDRLPVAGRDDNYFFLGAEPTWDDIRRQTDAARDIGLELTKLALGEHEGFRCIVLHGPAGSGKSTTLMRTAVSVAVDGGHVFFAQNAERLSFSAVLNLAKANAERGRRTFVFVDNPTRHLGAFEEQRTALREYSKLTLIVAERTNAYFNRCKVLHDLGPKELSMPDLSPHDVEAILDKLTEFGFLGVLRGKPRSEQMDAFMQRAKFQLLVALREATSGKGFDEILRDEFANLNHVCQLAYTICSLAVSRGAPGVYRRHLSPCLPDSGFKRAIILDEMLRGVLVPANASGTMLKPRHRVIGGVVAAQIASVELRQTATVSLLRQLAPEIEPNSIKRRSPAFLAYRGMINAEGLLETLSGDTGAVLEVFEALRQYYDSDFLFWLQYAIGQIKKGALDLAENFLNQSLAIRPKNFQTLHHYAVLRLIQAVQADNPGAVQETANEGIAILRSQIAARGDEDAYPYGAFLTHVARWYARAGALVSSKDWDDLRAIGREAIAKYPRDDYVRDAEKEANRLYMMRAVKS